MPAFALFFAIPTAVALTAVVHLLNNIFKLILVGRHANKAVVLRFALPAALMAFVGAHCLLSLSDLTSLFQYSLGGRNFEITPIKLVIAFFIFVFALFELLPSLRKIKFDRKYLGIGGALSGFFGGLSGHQGALRSAFLAKVGLETKAFIGTNVVCAVVVDCVRIAVYGFVYFGQHFEILKGGPELKLMLIATVFSFIGSFVGSRLIKKVTIESVQKLVGVMLLGLAVLLGTGLI